MEERISDTKDRNLEMCRRKKGETRAEKRELKGLYENHLTQSERAI